MLYSDKNPANNYTETNTNTQESEWSTRSISQASFFNSSNIHFIIIALIFTLQKFGCIQTTPPLGVSLYTDDYITNN